MTQPGAPLSLDALLADAAWIRRLARSLAGDAAVADDLTQEALVVGWLHPPATDRPVRAWFGRVVRNLAVNRHAQARARARREQETAPGDLPSPEEMTARMEVQRLVVGLVEELDEPYRHTVLLRYFEERSAEEIARAQGIPAGTVRWRLKVALDRLRRRLEEREGQPWRALLGALGPGAPPRRFGVRWVWPIPVVAALAVGGLRLAGRTPHEPPPSVAVPEGTPAPQHPAAAAVPARDALLACRSAVERLRHDALVVAAEIRRYRPAKDLFEDAPPNEAARAAITPLIDALVALPHTVECHTGACRIVALTPSQEEYEAGIRREHLPDLQRYVWRVELPTRYTRVVDPVSRGALRRHSFEVALKHPDGQPVDGDLPPDPRLPPPATLAACSHEREALEERLLHDRPLRDRVLPAMEQFARQPPNLPLTRAARERVRRDVGDRFDLGGIECHGQVCRVRDFELAGHLGRSAAFLDTFRGPWRDDTGAYFRAASGPPTESEAAAFLRHLLWQPGRPSPSGLDGFLPYLACRGRAGSDGPPAPLTIHLVVPATGEVNADGELDRISVHLDGEAALASPLGQCLAAELRRRLDDVRLPSPLPVGAEREMRLGLVVRGRPR